jgi:hypothetical protein
VNNAKVQGGDKFHPYEGMYGACREPARLPKSGLDQYMIHDGDTPETMYETNPGA